MLFILYFNARTKLWHIILFFYAYYNSFVINFRIVAKLIVRLYINKTATLIHYCLTFYGEETITFSLKTTNWLNFVNKNAETNNSELT